jgi:hypothetical protein
VIRRLHSGRLWRVRGFIVVVVFVVFVVVVVANSIWYYGR